VHIAVYGMNDTSDRLAAALRTRLAAGGYATVDRPLTPLEALRGWYAVKLSTAPLHEAVVLDGIDGPLEAAIATQISRLTPGDVILRRGRGEVFTPAALHVTLPEADAAVHRDVELAIFRGLDTVVRGRRRRSLRAWLTALLGATLLILAPPPAHAQTTNVRVIDENGSPLTVGDSASGAIKVKCIGGTCTGGGGSSAPTTASGTLTAATQSVDISTAGDGVVGITVSGTWSGTLFFRGKVAGASSWSIIKVLDVAGTLTGGLVTQASTNASLVFNATGYSDVQVYANAWTSGTASVALTATALAATQRNNVVLTNAADGGTAAIVGGALQVLDQTAVDALNLVTPAVTTPGADNFTAAVSVQGTTTGLPVHTVCDSGCGSPPATADGSTFTAGTTNVTPIAAVVDDTSTNTVVEDKYGAPRMSANRVLYVDLKQTQANATAIKVDGSAATQPVSGPLTDTQLRATPVPVSGPLTDTQLRATPVPVSGTVTTSPPSNASTNLNQVGGFAVDVNSGNKSTGTLRVVLATDQPQLTNKLLVTPDSVALPANQSVNVNQLAGTATSVNSGVKDAGTLRVVLATDQPQLTNKLLVTPDANSAINVAQVGGSSVSTAAAGVQKVGIVGNAGAAVDAANNAAMPANAVAAGLQTATIDTSPTAATAGNIRYQLASTEGVTYVQEGGPKRFSCVVPSTTTATTQCQAAPASGLRAYVTSLTMSNAAATVQTLDVVFGTGTNCATGTTALTHKVQFGTNATTTSPQSYEMPFPTPLVPTAANAICVRPSAATAFGATITGYIAP
jgi:hypothetical protein